MTRSPFSPETVDAVRAAVSRVADHVTVVTVEDELHVDADGTTVVVAPDEAGTFAVALGSFQADPDWGDGHHIENLPRVIAETIGDAR